MGLRQAILRHRGILALCVVVQVGVAVVGTKAWLAEHNNLHANGRWVSTKTILERGVLGAFAFTTTPNALAGGRLNLDAWHGFNEVVLAEPIDRPRTIEFDLALEKWAWLVVGFNRRGEGPYDAVRLSTARFRPSMFLRVDDEGAFDAKRALNHRVLEAPAEVRVRLELEAEKVRVLVDGELEGEFPITTVDRQQISFRSGRRPASVDEVTIVHARGSFSEDFDAPPSSRWLPLAAIAAVVVLNALLFALLCRGFGADDRFLGFRLLMIDLTLLAVGAIVYGYVVQGAKWYPRLGEVLAQSEDYFRKGELANVLSEIEVRHDRSRSADHRILFVGSSQTWGAGASKDDEAWVRVLESRLNRKTGSGAFECINAGVSSLRARDFEPLMTELLSYEPTVVVINLSSNDRMKSFIRSIRRLALQSLAAGARVVLVQEANAPFVARPGLDARHLEMARVAEELGLPLIDMDELLKGSNDQGFLWWDKVHLTSYGQRLMAEEMARRLQASGVFDTAAQ